MVQQSKALTEAQDKVKLHIELLCLLAAAPLYKKVGDEVVLKLDVTPVTITSITWKDGPNIAVQWDGTDTDYYRQFKGRLSGIHNVSVSAEKLTPSVCA